MITLKKFGPDHQPFIEALYRSTREAELQLTNWTEDQKSAFCHMQQFAQLADYRSQPGASHQVICYKKKPAGRLFCWEWAEEIRLADISLLPGFRGRGIGRAVLPELMATARRGWQALHSPPANSPIKIRMPAAPTLAGHAARCQNDGGLSCFGEPNFLAKTPKTSSKASLLP